MDVNFWHQRWQNSEIGFHRDDANPMLRRFWPQLNLSSGSRVLVPLCGKSLDLLWLRSAGHRVVGVELSELAVSQFFEEAGLTPEVSECGELRLWQADGIELYCGDFFELSGAHLGQVGAIYDRAALIALPGAMRQRYVEHLHSLAEAARGLLITLEYDQRLADGPPFSVTGEEVAQLYRGRIEVAALYQEATVNVPPKFRQSGIERMNERVYQLG